MELLWTMNCIIAGATIFQMVQAGQVEKAKEELESLSSELDSNNVVYLLNRVKAIANDS